VIKAIERGFRQWWKNAPPPPRARADGMKSFFHYVLYTRFILMSKKKETSPDR